jgi:hypothetical protein
MTNGLSGGQNRDGESGFNRWAISGVSRLMLIDAGETPDPAGPYVFQLALWALKTGKVEAEPDVFETLNAMPDWRPERVMNFLTLWEDHEEYEPEGWREAHDPESLARLVIADIEKKMVKHFPWYRSFD